MFVWTSEVGVPIEVQACLRAEFASRMEECRVRVWDFLVWTSGVGVRMEVHGRRRAELASVADEFQVRVMFF